MRILLTGTEGQVGGALLPLLQPRGEIIAPGMAEFNFTDLGSLEARLDSFSPDLIINPAAYTAVDRAEDETELAYLVNAKAPAVMGRWAARHRVPLLHFSTDYVFDGSGERPWGEDDTPRPLSVYGKSKLEGETAIREAGGPHLVARTSWVFAAKGANFMLTMIRLASERPELRVVSDQIGAPTSARSIAAAVMKLVEGDPGQIGENFAKAAGVVHLTNSGTTSWYGFTLKIVEGLRARGVPLKVSHVLPIMTRDYPTKALRPTNSRMDLTRLKQVFGITTPSWQDALETELDAFVQQERAAAS